MAPRLHVVAVLAEARSSIRVWVREMQLTLGFIGRYAIKR